MQSKFFNFMSICVVAGSLSLGAMEETEQGKELTTTKKIVGALSLYHSATKSVTEEQTEEFTTPFTYNIEDESGGFSLPKEYAGKVFVKDINKPKYLAFFYALMRNKEQFLAVFHTNNSHTLPVIFRFILDEKIKNKQVTSSNIGAYETITADYDYGADHDFGKDLLSKLCDIATAAKITKCHSKRLFLHETLTLELFLDQEDPHNSYFSTGTILPTYFCRPNEPHYLDSLATAKWWQLCTIY